MYLETAFETIMSEEITNVLWGILSFFIKDTFQANFEFCNFLCMILLFLIHLKGFFLNYYVKSQFNRKFLVKINAMKIFLKKQIFQ
jgi:hypothetical protein